MRGSPYLRLVLCVVLISSVIIFAPASTASAYYPQWHWLNPEPTGDQLNAVSMSPTSGSSCMWAVGNYGFIAKTFDYGQNWHKFDPTGLTGNPDLTDIDMLSDSVGWAVGTNGTIIKISEWWNTTVQTAPAGTGDLYAVEALNANTAYAVGYMGTVIKTLDGGTTWTTVNAGGQPGYSNFYAIHLLNNNQGWVAGDCNTGGNNIFFFTGAFLYNKSTADTTFDVHDIAVDPASNTIWAVGKKNTDQSALFYKATDPNLQTQDNVAPFYAMTPPFSPSFVTGYLTGISRPDATHILMTTSGGDIISGDGSAAWTKKSNPYPGRWLNDIDVHANAGAYRTAIVGNYGVLGYTDDIAAATPAWTTRLSATYNDLMSVDFISPAVGYVAAGYGVLKTENYGQAWSHLGADLASPLMDVDFKDASSGAAVGRSNGAFIYNGSWTTAYTGLVPGQDLYSVCYLSPTNIWASGEMGTITHWNGTVWTPSTATAVTTGNPLWRCVDFFDAAHGIAVSDSGSVVYTTDGGTTWTAGVSGVTERIKSVDMVSATTAFMVGDYGNMGMMLMRKTTNGGAAWSQMAAPAGVAYKNLEGVSFADANNGWAVGGNGMILHTTDGGTTWTKEDMTSEWLLAVSAADASSACAVGNFGHVLTNYWPPAPPAKTSVYRFYNLKNGTHFYTADVNEKHYILATWPNVYRLEGVGYEYDETQATAPLYRLYNKKSGSHFYTVSWSEVVNALNKWPGVFTYEGTAYNVSNAPVTGGGTVYRFYNMKNGSHFFTASEAERDLVIVNWPGVFKYEGPAFYLPM